MKRIYIMLIAIIITASFIFSYNSYQKRRVNVATTEIHNSSTIETNVDELWCGSFQLAWNELTEKLGGKIYFEDEKSGSERILNERKFVKEMLKEEDYYIKIKESPFNSRKLKEEIYSEMLEKFGTDKSSLLESLNFDTVNGIIIYSIIEKKFNFLNEFEDLGKKDFSDIYGNTKQIKYFGKGSDSDENLKDNAQILYDNDLGSYIIKLNTKEDEEIILYKTENVKLFSIEELYDEIIELSTNYKGRNYLRSNDTLEIPYINLNTVINYSDICNRTIKGTNGKYIEMALQDISFSLTPTGGNVKSEATIKEIALSIPKIYNFNSPFAVFIKEKDKEKPYFATKILDTTFLILD